MNPDAKMDQRLPEDRLKAAFGFDEPPARDYAFTARVMQEVARRQFLMSLLMLVPPTVAGAAVLWAVAPQLEPLAASALQGLQPVFAVTTVALFLAAAGWRLLKPMRT